MEGRLFQCTVEIIVGVLEHKNLTNDIFLKATYNMESEV